MGRRFAGWLAVVLVAGCASGRIRIRRDPAGVYRPPPQKTFLRGRIADPASMDGFVRLDRHPVRAEAVLLRGGDLLIDLRTGTEWGGVSVDLRVPAGAGDVVHPPEAEEGLAWIDQWHHRADYSWGRNRRRLWAKDGELILIVHDPTVPEGRTAGIFSIDTSAGRIEGVFAIQGIQAESLLDVPPEAIESLTAPPEPGTSIGQPKGD
jgi:hypothetical protein